MLDLESVHSPAPEKKRGFSREIFLWGNGRRSHQYRQQDLQRQIVQISQRKAG